MKQTKSGILIPPNISAELAPKYKCLLCGRTFTEEEAREYERHAVKCSGDHEEEIHAMSPRTKAPGIFDPNHESEAEPTAWMAKNKDAVLEGRKKP